MKKYCYVLVSTDGWEYWTRVIAADVEGLESSEWEAGRLDRLLKDGWRPCRETPMGGGADYCFALVVLERDDGPSTAFTRHPG